MGIPAVVDLLDATFTAQAWNAINKVNDGGVDLAEGQAANEPTAEYANGIDSCLQQISDFVRGVEQITALDIAGTLDVDSNVTLAADLRLLGNNPAAYFGSGSGSPDVYIRALASGQNDLFFIKGTTAAATGNYRMAHDASETWHFQQYFSAAWNDVFSVLSGSAAVAFGDDVQLTGDLLASSDNSTSIGASGGNRIAALWAYDGDFADDVTVGDALTVNGDLILGTGSTAQAAYLRSDAAQNGVLYIIKGTAGTTTNDKRILHATNGTLQFGHYNAGWNEVMQIGNNTWGVFGDSAAQAAAYTPTNVTTDRSYDANSTTLDEIADVLGTLIADLQTYGLLQ